MFSLGYARKTFMFVSTRKEVSSLFFLLYMFISKLVRMSHVSRVRRKLRTEFIQVSTSSVVNIDETKLTRRSTYISFKYAG